MSINKKKSFISINAAYAVLFIASALFVLWKCRYGIGSIDEAFNLTIPYRLNQGDSLLANEWHLSQMVGFIFLPFMKLYMAMFKTTEGIILNYRYICIAVQGITSLLIFKRYKKINLIGAAVASIAFFLYTPYNISALSYSSTGIIILVLTTMLLLTEKDGAKRKAIFVLAGILFAAAVLCCPYLVFVYALYTVCAFAFTIYNKKKSTEKKDRSVLSVKSWFVLSCGIGILAIVFMAFVLSRASLQSIIDSFAQIFNDPEHQDFSITNKLFLYAYFIVYSGQKSEIIYALAAIGFVITFLDKKREERSHIYLSSFAVLTAAVLVSVFIKKPYINFVMFPINILALECAIIFWKDETIRKIFLVVWVTGIAYSVCCNFSSNQTYYAVSSASSVAFAGSIVIIFLSLGRLKNTVPTWGKRTACLSVALLLLLQIGMEVYLRYEQVFWEPGGISAQTELITDGPQKGVYTTAKQKQEYYDALKIKEQVIEKYGTDKSILCLSGVTWYYLVFEDYRNSSYSAWLSGVNEITFERLEEYYKINPEKVPDMILIDWTNVDYLEDFRKDYIFDEEVFDNGSVLMTNFMVK